MKFFTAVGGADYPLSRIKYVHGLRVCVEDGDGERMVDITQRTHDELIYGHDIVIPATPGMRLIAREDDGSLSVGETVIAWKVSIDVGMCAPMGMGGDFDNMFGVLHTDGTVDCCDASFDNLEAAEKYSIAKMKKRKPTRRKRNNQ